MPAKKKPASPPVPGQPRHYDPSLGKAALADFAPRMKALAPDALVTTRMDIEASALAALATYARATAPALRARFQKQHDAGEFDIGNLDNLENLVFAALYALSEASVHRAAESSTAKLPSALVDRAIEIEGRMQTLCEYHFRDDPEVAHELDRLRPGTSHRDLASDLNGYARIYDMRKDVVVLDRKHYRDTDVADARVIAGVILTTLSAGTSSKARIAQDSLARVWTLLCQSYDEVRAVGLHLLRNNQDKHRFFPSLFAIGRNVTHGRRKSKTAVAESSDSAAVE